MALAVISLWPSTLFGAAKVELINCGSKATTSFAIFIDSKTFERCRTEVLAYKQILESEGLGTYVVSSSWERPEEVKEQIAKLASRKPILEGMVFIGEIPIVRIQKGQHLTTAFKMNEKTFPIDESSVPSDRFYDCPDLEFDFVGRDSVHSNWFYFNLSHRGAQRLTPAYYSARMVVPQDLIKTTEKDQYEYMKCYLTKVVAAHEEKNLLDKFICFAGHGYNSDCLTAWRQQSLVFKEYFPEAFTSAFGNTFLNFRQDPQMKFKLFTYMQNPHTDVFVFNEHGAPETQYINGNFPAVNMDQYLKVLGFELRSASKRIKADKKVAFVQDVCAHFGLNPNMFSVEKLKLFQTADSLMRYNKDIHLVDLAKLKTGSRVTILNACYNGSFHQSEYVAGYHIFNDGRTVVAQGNTVNVLQDKWAEQLIGILSLGARIGFWQKEVITLESHLIGDPTFRFGVSERRGNDLFVKEINKHLATSLNQVDLWKNRLESKDQILRALGIKQLQKIYLAGSESERMKSEIPGWIELLYSKDRSMIVRMQALNALSIVGGEILTRALMKGLGDPYEMIRRQSAHWAGKHGAPTLVPMLEHIQTEALEVQRVRYAAGSALTCYDSNFFVDLQNSRAMDEIRRLRNYPNHPNLSHLLTILSDENVETEVRVLLCEALGWYDYAVNKKEIIQSLTTQLSPTNTSYLPEELKSEMEKTLKRLRIY